MAEPTTGIGEKTALPQPAALLPAAAAARPASLRSMAAHSFRYSQAVVGIIVLLAVWELITRLFHPLPVILPPLADVAARVAHLLWSADTRADLGISIARVLAGFSIGTATGIFTAVLLARHPLADRSLRYVLVALRFVIPFAWVPIAAYWFGLSEVGKVFITWYASFFVIVFQVRAGIEAVPDLYIKVAQTFGLSRRRTLWQVILPAAWPNIVVGMRLGLSFAWVAILAAEMVNANSGIGYFINYSGQFLATNDVMAGMIIIGVLGYVSDQALSWAGRRIVPTTASLDG